MDTTAINYRFKTADRSLREAKEELNRPAEDVVPFMVCRSVRHSISNNLMGFLMKHGIQVDENAPVKTLLENCSAIDKKFRGLELTPISFVMDEEYSATFDKMESCIDLATYVRQLVGGKYQSN
ncbi:hypothetical protein [Robertkochia sediminum]|uniref:hypothetical protein n=1 Tax=Robertkochia sediminum TaxID=2785326 RepID=UPI001932B912|nr:hypothetical protein [Robertkochia sediminum]MBL7472196.1 hypothetical protein [Robertkochia sediminum]